VFQGVARSMRHVLAIQKRLVDARALTAAHDRPGRTEPAALTARVDAVDGRD
jgi:hypothetical protein